MHVTDLEGNDYPLQATSENEGEVNGNQSFTSTILPTKVNKAFIDDISEMWNVVDHDDVEHKIIYCKRRGVGNFEREIKQRTTKETYYLSPNQTAEVEHTTPGKQGNKMLTVEIKAIPLFFDVLDNDRIYERYDEHMPAQRAFNRIFEDTGFVFVLGSNFSAVEWEGFGDGETKLETFKRALNRYKCEFHIVGRTVYLESQIGRDTQFMYRHRLNASNIEQEIDANEMWTYAKGYGDYEDGEDEGWETANLKREYTSPLADIIGIRHAPPIKDGRVTDKKTMDNALKELVDESLKISLTADIHDLRKQGYPLAQSQLGDRVFLIDERIGLNEEIRVVAQSIKRDWKGNILDLNVTFGSEGLSKRHQSSINTATKDINEILEGRKQLPYSVLDDAVKNATKALQDAQTELKFTDNGILAIDKNDPNLVTLFNSAGIGVSDDGGATFGQALTGRGLNADYVYTGSMLADFIAGGTLASLNGNLEFDMNKGNFDMKNAHFTLGGGATIDFTSSGNKITYRLHDDESNVTRVSGFGVGKGSSDRYPFAHLGTTGQSEMDTLSDIYSGFIAVTTRSISEGGTNSINGKRLTMRNTAVDYDRGLTFDFYSNPSITPINGNTYNYNIGSNSNPFQNLYARSFKSNNEAYISDRYSNGGFLFTTEWSKDPSNDVTNLVFRGINYGSGYRYNLGASNSPFSFAHIGTVRADYLYGSVEGTSARKFKTNIKDMDLNDSLEFVRNAIIKKFYWKKDENPTLNDVQVSFMLDDLDMKNDYLVKRDDETYKTANVIFMQQQVIQHNDKRITEMEDKLSALEAQING